MVRKLHLHNFKCFEDIEIPLNMLTLLAGENGSGKSSIIQALLLFAQSVINGKIEELYLFGDYVKLGYSNDIIYEFSEETNPRLNIELFFENDQYSIDVEYKSRVTSLPLSSTVQVNYKELFRNKIEYIAADRISPDVVFSSFDRSDSVGIHGESVMNYLNRYGTKPIHERLCVADVENTLATQLDYWMGQLFNGFSIRTEEVFGADMIKLRYQEISMGDKSNERRPINVGFGITYILPIVVALLKAEPGDLVIIENPECHLHPRAQRRIGEMISNISSAGVQIIVETHSDHVLNGIRLSVKRGDLDKQNTQILFTAREDIGRHYHSNVYSPVVLDNGDLEEWPEGFFDEWDNALIELLD